MIRQALAAGTLLLAIPATAQTTQDALQARYDRALAAGYKALMLCGAIGHGERNSTPRSAKSVIEWELTGIQAPLDQYVRTLPHKIVWAKVAPYPNGVKPGPVLSHVSVSWSPNDAPRVASFQNRQGCSLLPIGSKEPEPRSIGIASPPWTIPSFSEWPPTDRKKKLQAVLARSMDGSYGEGSRTTAALVGDRNSVFASVAAPGIQLHTPQRTWSVAKSLSATLIGVAVHRGEVSVEASAGLGVDESDPRRAITIDHLLRMASGRYSDTPGNRTDALYYGGATVQETALHWPLVHQPGIAFRYANNDTLAAVHAVKNTSAFQRLPETLSSLGLSAVVAESDWQGDYVLSSQVWASAGEFLNLGRLYLNDGVLRTGKRVLPEGWVKYVSIPSGPQPDGPLGYGAGFWLLNKSEGVPPDTFAAFGNRGQFIIIVPSMNVVIVRRGEDPAGKSFDIARFTRDVLESIKE